MKRKLMLLSIFLVALLAVSFVSAADDAASDVVGVNDDINETAVSADSMDNEIGTTEELSVLGDDFDELQAAVDSAPEGSVLYLYRDYTKDGDDPIYINKDLTIDGTGHTINCDGEDFTAFYSDTGRITLKNLRIINGHNDENYRGGAIYIGASASYTIENCVFEDNWADDYGGAIFNSGENPLRIINCKFNRNKVDDEAGGAIYSVGELYIENTIFDSNIADNNAGAIYKEGQGSMTLINCQFTNNKADDYDAGAIYTSVETVIDHCTFDSNHACDYAGAIYKAGDKSMRITNSEFKNNGADNKDGGAIYATGELSIENSSFSNNFADNNGGAIYVAETQQQLSIINSQFNNNKADDDDGGAICTEAKIYLKNSIFTGNSANDDGGALRGSTVIGNDIDIYGCTFEKNSAGSHGGAIKSSAQGGYAEISITNSTFKTNTAKGKGGAICSFQIIVDFYKDNQIRSYFIDNTADEGGAIFSWSESVAMEPVIYCAYFCGNKANGCGGAIYSHGHMSLFHSIFDSNKAEGAISSSDGGATYSRFETHVTQCRFVNNYAENNGGAIYAETVKVQSYSYFENNEAYKGAGGAIWGGSFLERIEGGVFIGNKAGKGAPVSDDGGAIYINDEFRDYLLITGCVFIRNSCTDEGGAIYANTAKDHLTIKYNAFVDNSARDKGQSVYNCGHYDALEYNWHGTNSPDFTDQFKDSDSDEDHTPSNHVEIDLKMYDSTFYKGNPYMVTTYFYPNTNPDETIDDMPVYELIYSGDGEFSNPTNHQELTKNVTFTKSKATIYAKLDHETLSLNVYVQDKNPTSVNIISCPDIYYPETLKVEYEISKNNNATYEIKDNAGKIIVKGNITDPNTLSIEGLSKGQYVLTIFNPETLSDLPSSASANFTVKRLAHATISADYVTYGKATTVILNSDVDGKYNVSLNENITVEIDVINGTGVWQVFLDAGTYKTHTIFKEPGVELNVTETMVYVDKAKINIDLSVDKNIVYPNNITGVITTDVPGKYEITLTPSGIAQNVTLGKEPYRFNLGTLPVQSYTLRVVSKEVDKNYNQGSVIAQINVIKGTPSITLSIPDTNTTDEVYAYAHSNVDGIYTLKINDMERTMNITHNVGTLNLGYLDMGNYSARLDFAGDDNYNPAYNTTSFKVSKLSTEFKLNTSGSEFVYGDEIEVTHILTVKATGYILYKLNNEIYANLTVDKNLMLSGLDADSYLIEATYSGDHDYESSKDTIQIKINKAQNNVKVSVGDVTYGSPSIIKIQADADGTYTVDINGTTVAIDVINGSGEKSVSLNADAYSTRTVFDSKNYDTKITEAAFTVFKAPDNVNVSVDNVSYGQDSIICIDADVDGWYAVNIGGSSFGVNVINGKGSQKVRLVVGKFVTKTSFTDENYELDVDEAVFEVEKAVNNVLVVVDDVVYGESSVITINAVADGTYLVNIGNTSVSVDVVNGRGVNSVKLNAGTYATSTSFDHPCYVNNVTEDSFQVLKADVALRIVVLDCTYPSSVNGTIFTNVNGLYTVKIGNYSSSIDITDNVGIFDAGVLDAGVYNATVIFDGDDNHNANTSMVTFTVNKRTVDFRINANATDVVYRDSIEVTPVFDVEVNGTIKYSVDGNVFCEVPVSESVIFDLDAGYHVILADYSGDKNNKKASATVKVYVKRFINIVNVNVEDVTYGMQSVIEITADADGIYYVAIGGNTIEVNVLNNKGNASVNLDVGKYHTVTRFNNRNYDSRIADADFEVAKANITLTVDIDDESYAEKISGNVYASVDGVYTLAIGNYRTGVAVEGGVGLIKEAWLLDVGDYEANISFAGDHNYNPVLNKTLFHISKADTILYVIALDTVHPNIVYGAVLTDCNDTIKVYVTNVGEFNITVGEDKVEIFDLGILNVGEYNITAVFDGNKNFNNASSTYSFNVTEGNVNFTISTNSSSFIYNENVVVYHSLTEGATGTIKYYLYDGTFLGEADVSENFTLPVFDCGEYIIVGIYSGDDVYVSATGILNFTVDQAPNNVVVSIEDVTYGVPAVINVHADVDWIYAVNIGGWSINVEVVGGEGSRSVVLDAGNYTTTTAFNNKNYDTVITETTFEVKKADVELNITVEDASYPYDVVGVVYASADGEYDVRIGNVTRTVNVKDGMGRFDMGVLDAGDYDATVIFNGTSNYNENRNITTFTVNKGDISLIVNIKDCVYHDEVVVNVHASVDGEYRLVVGSVNTTFDVIDNEASVNVGELNAGEYVAYVLFDGNRNYNSNSNSTNFTVNKAKSNITIDINGTEFVYDQHITVTHNLTEDALGYITYFLGDGSEIAQTSVDSDYVLPVLDVGEYWIIALYEGDGNYYPAVDLVKFSIVPAENSVVVNVADVTYGTPSIIHVMAGVDGNYTLDVNGSKYEIPVVNGIGTYSLDLDVGQYYANVTFNNKNYNSEYRNAEFRVNRALNNVVVNVADVMYGYHSLIEVSADVDGVYAVEVNGTVYNVTVRDKFGSKSTVLLDVGNFTTKTVFFDKNYDTVITDAAFEVYKVDIPYVFFLMENTTYGEPVVIYMVSPVNGIYNVSLNGVWFDVEVVDYFGVYYIGVLDAGDYVLFTSCDGDEHFNPTNTSESFTVFKANNTATVNVSDVTYGEDTIIIVAADVDGNYTIDVNGTLLSVLVSEGRGNVTLRFNIGTYYANVTFDNRNYDTVSHNAVFTVNKIKTTITAKSITTTYKVNKNLVITLKDANGKALSGVKVTVKLKNTKTYTTDKNGQIKVSTKGLVPKKYTAKITFNGNAYYAGSTKSVKVTVKKAKSKITARAKVYRSSLKVKKYAVVLKSGKSPIKKSVLTLKVGKKTYKAKTNNKGKAIFKITKLTKKGRYTAVVKYKGNKYYTAKTVKSRIIIR